MITLTQKGNFKRVAGWLERINQVIKLRILNKYGEKGVAALSAATPVDSGKTAASWSYDVQNDGNSATITFKNSNVNKGVNIAIILQYGHGTGTGGWVQGRDYINPAIQPIFDELAEKVWEEVTSV